MHDESEPTVALQRLLDVHRRTISFLEVQRAYFGAFAPPYIWHQFDEARGEISRIKSELRALGVQVQDAPGDIAPPNPHPTNPAATDIDALLLVYRRMLIDQVRYAPQFMPSAWGNLYLQLTELYVERTFIPLHASGSNTSALYQEASSLFELMSKPGTRILLEGEAGSGKTTALQMLALACAARATGEPAEAANLVAAWPDPIPLPIFLKAREIATMLVSAGAAPDGMMQPGPSVFWSSIERWLQFSDLDALVPTIQQLLERGECLVMIDDLDDFPTEPQPHAYWIALGRFIARYPNNRYLLSWRALDSNAAASLINFVRYRIAPFEQQQIDEAVSRWYTAIGDFANLLLPEMVAERVAQLQGALNGDDRLLEVARTPRGVSLYVLAHAEGYSFPAERAIVLQRLAQGLMQGWEHMISEDVTSRNLSVHTPITGTTERWLTMLELLALAFQERLEPGNEQPSPLSYAEIKAYLSESRSIASFERRRGGIDMIAELIRWCCRCGLLASVGTESYTMPNRQLREYLAARALVQLPDFPARASMLGSDPQWHEALQMAVHGAKRGQRLSSTVKFLNILLESDDLKDEQVRVHVLLAAECLLEIGDRGQLGLTIEAKVCQLLTQMRDDAECPIAHRIQAGMLLGRLGDALREPELPVVVHVPAGTFILGYDQGFADETPRQEVYVPEFAIGMHPVTNREYKLFLDENRAVPRPHYWYDLRFNNPACPVVGVTWHDATNYCAWLTRRLTEMGKLAPGLVVRLPREVEWEKAASWDAQLQKQRRYPWGDEWDNTRANTADGRQNWYTAPIGCYPTGVSPYGAHDMIGNVWEWTIDQYRSYPNSSQPFDEAGRYTLRGSSCAAQPTHARCTYRSRLPPTAWRYHLGFRVVIGPPIDES
mgnify:CR=1 FL=1